MVALNWSDFTNSYEKPVKPMKIIKVLEDRTNLHESARKIKILARDACDSIFCIQYDIQKDSWANTCPTIESFVNYCPLNNDDIGNTYDFDLILMFDDFSVDDMDISGGAVFLHPRLIKALLSLSPAELSGWRP